MAARKKKFAGRSGTKGRVGPQPLNDKQYRAITEYFANGFQKKKALLAAGYSESTADNNAKEVFSKPCVVAEIARRRKAMIDDTQLDRAWIIKRLMALAMANETLAPYKKVGADGMLYWDFTGASEAELKLVNGLMVDVYVDGKGKEAREIKKMKIDTSDPLAVLSALARIEGLFQDKLKIEGEKGIVELLQEGRRRVNPQPDPETVH